MPIKIGGDMLAMNAGVRRQIEEEAEKLNGRFPGEYLDQQVTIQEEFDQLRGHRIRCELTITTGAGKQIMVRDAAKELKPLIEQVYSNARRSIVKARRQDMQSSPAMISA